MFGGSKHLLSRCLDVYMQSLGAFVGFLSGDTNIVVQLNVKPLNTNGDVHGSDRNDRDRKLVYFTYLWDASNLPGTWNIHFKMVVSIGWFQIGVIIHLLSSIDIIINQLTITAGHPTRVCYLLRPVSFSGFAQLMVNWWFGARWFGIRRVTLSTNPFHFRGSQESKPPIQTTNLQFPRHPNSSKYLMRRYLNPQTSPFWRLLGVPKSIRRILDV